MSKKGSRPSIVHNVNIVSTEPRSRMSLGGSAGGMSSIRTNVVRSNAFHPTRKQGEMALLSKRSVETVKDTRTKEKGQLTELNRKLADQLDSFAYLEGVNTQLKMDRDYWKNMHVFNDANIKDLISAEIEELRNDCKALSEKNSALEAEKLKLLDQVDTMTEDFKILKNQRDTLANERDDLARLNQQQEAESGRLKTEIEIAEQRYKRCLEELNGTKDDVDRLRGDLEAARIDQIDATDELAAFKAEAAFADDLKTEELEECKRLIKKMQANEPNYSKMWESKFKDSLMALQNDMENVYQRQLSDQKRDFDLKISKMQASMNRDVPDSGIEKATTKTLKTEVGSLNSKLSDLQRDNDSLRRQLELLKEDFARQCEECEREKEELRDEIEREKTEKDEIEDELNALELTKNDLVAEITTYRTLLNTGTRMRELAADQGNFQSQGGALASQMIMGGGGSGGSGAGGSGGGSSSQSSNPSKGVPANKPDPAKKDKQPTPSQGSKKKPDGEVFGRLTTTKKGTQGVIIDSVPMDGNLVKVVNNTGSDKNIGGWTLSRTVDGKGEVASYTFESGTVLRGRGALTVYASAYDDLAVGKDDLVAPKSGKCRVWGTGTGQCTLTDNKREQVAVTMIKQT